MNVLLLAFDGLELLDVERLNCIQLKQNVYGKLEVPINKDVKQPASATVWASFLAGEHIEKTFIKHQPRFVDFLSKIRQFLPFQISLGLGRRFRSVPPRFPELSKQTLMDKISDSYAIDVPYINCDNQHLALGFNFTKRFVSVSEVIKEGLRLFGDKQTYLYDNIVENQEHSFVFGFLGFPDTLAHCCLFDLPVMDTVYSSLNDLVARIRKTVDKDTVIYIMSDHGFNPETGNHSNYGFISCNKRDDPLPTSIYELHERIVDMTG